MFLKFIPTALRFLVFGVSILLASSGTAFSQGAASFAAPRAYDGGAVSAAGDLNGDGKADIVSVKPGLVSYRIGNGFGDFNHVPSTAYQCPGFTSTAMSTPFVADFTGDGKTDVAVWIDDSGCRGARALMVLPGNGSGGFAAPIFTEISNFVFTPNQFASADLNGDGRPDIAVATAFSGTGDRVGIWLNNGNGTFAAPVEYSFTGGQSGYNMTLGDQNNDNRPDIFYGSQSPSNVMAMANNGNGTFAAPVTAIAGTNTLVGAGTFDAGSNLDLITAQTTGPNPSLRAWLGNGSGTFAAAPQLTLTLENSGLGRVLPGDFNNDGKQDLALQASDRVVIVRGVGDGTFVEDEIYGAGGGSMFKADLDGDGWLDLGVTQPVASNGNPFGSSTQFAVLLNSGTGKLLTAPGFQLTHGGEELALADFNGDGLKDIVVTGDSKNGEILLILQQANRSFDRAAAVGNRMATVPGISPSTLAVGDLNADNKNDVVIAGRRAFGGTFNVLAARNDGAGNFTVFSTMNLPGDVTKVITGHFNADNILDLAFTEKISTTSPIPSVYVALGTGNGSYATPVGYLNNLQANSLTAADLTGDGSADLGVGLTNGSVAILTNNGAGTFTAGSTYDLGAAVTDIGSADMNGDGKADLVVANNLNFISNTAKISVLNGIGNGTFAAAVNYPTVWLYDQKLALNDYNGDGKTDVATSNNSVVSVLVNNGFGVLHEPRLWAVTGGLRAITSGDLDGDGKPDLITSSAYDNFFAVSILFNLPLPILVQARAPFDFDGDGKTDISIFRPNGAVSEWWWSRSLDGGTGAVQFGSSTDRMTPLDFTGDGKADVAFWRQSTGQWFVLRSEDQSFYAFPFGTSGDMPVPADYDGDGKADAAVYRESTMTWYINRSSGGTDVVAFGATGDKPIPADFDGDGKTDIAISRPGAVNGAEWWVRRSSNGTVFAAQFGQLTDKPVIGDYTGDGKADIAFWRPSSGYWYVLRSEDFSFYAFPFGTDTDRPVPGDYDGDRKIDAAIFRPSTATWYVNRSTAGLLIQQFGQTGDLPVPGAFIR